MQAPETWRADMRSGLVGSGTIAWLIHWFVDPAFHLSEHRMKYGAGECAGEGVPLTGVVDGKQSESLPARLVEQYSILSYSPKRIAPRIRCTGLVVPRLPVFRRRRISSRIRLVYAKQIDGD